MKRYSNLSKFFYDIAKLTFGGFIVGSIVSKEVFDLFLIGLGLCITSMFVIITFLLDKEGGE